MSKDPKVLKALEAIKKLTDEEKIKWEGVKPKSHNPLQVMIGENLIRITNSGSSLLFEIFKDGQRIGVLAESHVDGTYGLSEFWKKIERKSRGIDEALDSLLSDLDEISE